MANNKLRSEELTFLYAEQWKQIRHLDKLDMRIMTLVPLVVATITLSGNIMVGVLSKISADITNNKEIAKYTESTPEILKSLFFASAIIVLGISSVGCYTTMRNWICYMRRMHILTALEKEMGMVERNIIEKNIQFNPPQNLLAFMSYFRKSIRFPLSLLYAFFGGLSIILFRGVMSFSLFSGIIAAVVIIFLLFSYCVLENYSSYKSQFINKNDKVETSMRTIFKRMLRLCTAILICFLLFDLFMGFSFSVVLYKIVLLYSLLLTFFLRN